MTFVPGGWDGQMRCYSCCPSTVISRLEDGCTSNQSLPLDIHSFFPPPLPPKVMMTTTIHTHPLPPFLDRLLLSHPHRTFLRSRIFRIFFPSIPPIDNSFIPAACTGRPRVNLVSSLQPSTLRQSSMHPGLVATGLLASRTGNTVTSSKMD